MMCLCVRVCVHKSMKLISYCSAFSQYNTEQFTPAKVGEDQVGLIKEGTYTGMCTGALCSMQSRNLHSYVETVLRKPCTCRNL